MIPSVNLASVPRAPMREALPLCREAGFEGVGLCFDAVEGQGLDETVRLVTNLGLSVTSLCPSGTFGDYGEEGFKPVPFWVIFGLDDNLPVPTSAPLCVLRG